MRQVDETLFSRQLSVPRHSAPRAALTETGMGGIASPSALIVGLQGLGAEVAKNLCLAGFKSLSLFDPEIVTIEDLGSQFLLREEDVGVKSRAEASAPRLVRLLQEVEVEVLPELSLEAVKKFAVVILCNAILSQQLEINTWTRDNGVHLVCVEARGLFGSLFVELCDTYTYKNSTGEEVKTGRILSIDELGVVRCPDEMPHDLSDGDFVTFAELDGPLAPELNACEPRRISVLSKCAFTVDHLAPGMGAYASNSAQGVFMEVHMPQTVSFRSLHDCLESPRIFTPDAHPETLSRAQIIHRGFRALSQFRAQNPDRRLPRVRNDGDAARVLSIATTAGPIDSEMSHQIITEMAYQARGSVPPFNALLGALAAQQAIAACAKRFTPLHSGIGQLFYLDALDCLPSPPSLPTEADCAPDDERLGSRYDGQIAVFGRQFVEEKVMRSRQMLVGAGAVGTEVLRNWALMGVGVLSTEKPSLHIIDPDTVERHNLALSGGLFCSSDSGKMKADVVKEAMGEINPDLLTNVHAHTCSFASSHSGFSDAAFHEDFFATIDGITTAVENLATRVQPRRRPPPLYEKPLIGHRHRRASKDRQRREIPTGTITNSRNRMEHTVDWATHPLSRTCSSPPARRGPSTLGTSLPPPKTSSASLKARKWQAESEIDSILEHLGADRPKTFTDCILWARAQFDNFSDYPTDERMADGSLWWTWPRCLQRAVPFDIEQPLHLESIISASNLRATNHHIRPSVGFRRFSECPSDFGILSCACPTVQPAGMRAASSKRPRNQTKVVARLELPAPLPPFPDTHRMIPAYADVEHNRDFLVLSVPPRTFERRSEGTKRIVGKLVPKLGTTAAVAGALACLELYKVCCCVIGSSGYHPTENSFFNLAMPLVTQSEPLPPKKSKYDKNNEWTSWDRFEFTDVNMTLHTCGTTLLWGEFTSKAKGTAASGGLSLRFRELFQLVSKKAIPPHAKQLQVEVMVEDESGEDVDHCRFRSVVVHI
ncbi:hypothetical protein C8F01DRAFT_1160039 [Mycena amicta]|nr:hypothetical protein C8F01DRAFT_1160039 [Mycena amicta]